MLCCCQLPVTIWLSCQQEPEDLSKIMNVENQGQREIALSCKKTQNIYVFCCFCVSAADFPQTQAASTVVLSHKHSRSLSALCTPVEIVWIRRSSCSEWAGGRAEPEFLPHFSHVTHRKHKLTLTCCLDIILSYCITIMCQRPASLPLLLRCGHQHITII